MAKDAAPEGRVETLPAAAGAVIIGLAVTAWLGARLAVTFTGGTIHGGLDTWLRAVGRLATGHSPHDAWDGAADGLPPAWLYWACTLFTLGVVGAVATGVVWLWRRL